MEEIKAIKIGAVEFEFWIKATAFLLAYYVFSADNRTHVYHSHSHTNPIIIHGDDRRIIQIVWKTAQVLISNFDYIMSGVVILYDYYASGLIGIDISTPGDMASYK